MPEPLGDELSRFILTSIPSVPYLEAMLRLRARPRGHTAASMAAEIYVSEAAAGALLQALAAAGVARAGEEGPEFFEYGPADPALASLIDALARAYSLDLVGVTRLIHDSTRRSAMHFADAFRFRKAP